MICSVSTAVCLPHAIADLLLFGKAVSLGNVEHWFADMQILATAATCWSRKLIKNLHPEGLFERWAKYYSMGFTL